MSIQPAPAEPPAIPSGYPGATWAFHQARLAGFPLRIPSWGMGDVLICLLGSLTFSAVALFALSKNHIDPQHGWGLVLAFMSPWVFLAGWPLVTAYVKGNGPTIDFGLTLHRPHIRLGILAGLVSLALATLAASITVQLLGPISSSAGDMASKQHGPILIVFALLALVGAPLVEELAFRGLLFGALLKSQFTPVLASLTSAGVFALFHFEPKRLLVLFVVGFVLGEARRRSGSTMTSVVAHAVNNAPGVLALLGMNIGFIVL